MIRPKATVSGLQSRELFVFECFGSQPPLGEPEDSGFLGIWSEPPCYYLFFEHEPGAGLAQWLATQPGWVLRDRYNLAYDQWQQVSSERLRVGPFIVQMQREYDDAVEGLDGMLIRLDPGLVFGSGLHGSTRGCLLSIADIFGRVPITSAVDLGTGTGILAISCAILGAAKVLAIDNNPLAVREARRNTLLNGVEDRVEVMVADGLDVLRTPSDLLLMNLEWPSLQRVLARDEWLGYRWVVLSGFLDSQWDKVKDYLPPAFCIRYRQTIDDWLTVTISKSESE